MNNAGTVLLTLADMSIIQAEVEVDETNIPNVQLGQPAKITIDAIPDKTFKGHVTEIGNSPIQATTARQRRARRRPTFKVVVILDETIPDVRPGFTLHGGHHDGDAQRRHCRCRFRPVAVRELTFDAERADRARAGGSSKRRRAAAAAAAAWRQPVNSLAELKPGETRKETEGVFVVRDEGKDASSSCRSRWASRATSISRS